MARLPPLPKSGDEIVGVADRKHVTLPDFLSPYIYSEVEHKQAEGDFPLPNKLRRPSRNY